MLHARKPHAGKPLFFGGTTAHRGSRARACFNFTSRDDLLFAELARLTERGHQHLLRRGRL